MIKQRKRNKRAVFFSLDALIALVVIILSITVIYPIIKYSQKESYIPEDVISSLSTLKIKEYRLSSPLVQSLIDDGNITNLNKSVLEQIGEFYVSTDPAIKIHANELAEEVLLTISTSENIGLWYEDDLLASRNKTSFEDAKNVNVERQTISGIKEGSATTGFSARAFLKNNVQTKYYYYGGYVGEGNISLNIEYSGTLRNITLEIAANKDFFIYVNGAKLPGVFQPAASDFIPYTFPLEAYIGGYFSAGVNTVKLVAADGVSNLHVSGGYLKLTYEDGVQYEQPIKYYFPGVEGLINIYDGFYVPGQMNNLKVYLHFKSNYTSLFTIGNESIYQYQTAPSLSDQEQTLYPVVNYNALSKKTVPIRFRLANVSYIAVTTIPVDVFSVNDISGSMCTCNNTGNCCNYRTCNTEPLCENSCGGNFQLCSSTGDCCDHYNCNNQVRCQSCGGTWSGGNCNNPYPCTYNQSICENSNKCNGDWQRCDDPFQCNVNDQQSCENPMCGGVCIGGIHESKNATNAFIDLILNTTNNKVGLAAYSTSALSSNSHGLSNNSVSLKNEVASWNAVGGTCICCGINRATNSLLNDPDWGPDKFNSIVVMSDGAATLYCSSFNDYDGSGTGGSSDLIDRSWAINASCHAWQNHGIRVYAIGFGPSADTATLQAIANCGNGSYYNASIEDIINVYNQVAQDIIEAAYVEQTVQYDPGYGDTILYPDSYIEFNYTKEPPPYGLTITEQEDFSDTYSGTFSLPSNSTIVETRVISYSGPRWTKDVIINNTVVYNLSKYGDDYVKLGDPYAINIPNSAVASTNTVTLTTGVSPQNTSEGSSANKIIYIVLKEMVSYSAISEYSVGCNWTVQFEDGTYLTLQIPSEATDDCHYMQVGGSPSYQYSTQDALQLAIFNLFRKLDLDNNGKLDVKFTEQNLEINSFEVTGIPFTWETVVQVRKWW